VRGSVGASSGELPLSRPKVLGPMSSVAISVSIRSIFMGRFLKSAHDIAFGGMRERSKGFG